MSSKNLYKLLHNQDVKVDVCLSTVERTSNFKFYQCDRKL